MNPVHRYSFNLPWPAVILGGAFYAGLAIFMAHLAMGYAGLVFAGFITLSATSAGLGLILITRRLIFPRAIELTDDAVLFPRGFPRTRIKLIPFSNIIRMLWTQTGLYMVTAEGSYEITASHFKEIESYRTVTDFICTKTSIVMPRRDKRESQNWGYLITWGFPEPILRWDEPKEWPRYRTHLAKSKPILNRLGKALWFFARCFGICSIPWLLLVLFQVPTAPALEYLCLVTAIALFLTLIYHWLAMIWPVHCTEISFRDNGITQFFGKQTVDWNYHHFSGWTMVEREFEGRAFFILLLEGRSRIVAFAIPDTEIRDQLVQILQNKKIPQSPNLKPPWESREES